MLLRQRMNQWRDITYTQMRRLSVVITLVLIYKFNAIPIKIPTGFFIKLILKLIRESKIYFLYTIYSLHKKV